MHAEGRLGSRAVARKAAERSAGARARQAEHRASRIAQDLFERHRDDVERALLDALRHGSRSQKIRAAETLTELALSGERIDTSAEKVHHEHLDRQQLLDTLAAKLTSGPTTRLIGARLAESNGHDADVIDVQAVELPS